jgi:hypothetical protein
MAPSTNNHEVVEQDTMEPLKSAAGVLRIDGQETREEEEEEEEGSRNSGYLGRKKELEIHRRSRDEWGFEQVKKHKEKGKAGTRKENEKGNGIGKGKGKGQAQSSQSGSAGSAAAAVGVEDDERSVGTAKSKDKRGGETKKSDSIFSSFFGFFHT